MTKSSKTLSTNFWQIITCTFILCTSQLHAQSIVDHYGVVVRSDTTTNKVYLLFTGHDFDEGFAHVDSVLQKFEIKSSFFLTGDFVRNHKELTLQLHNQGHFVGAHSDKHLLYNDWSKRDSLLISREIIKQDIKTNLEALQQLGIKPSTFMPPYEWYTTAVVEIARELGQTTINFSPGTRSNADYTTPEMKNYVSTETILKSIFQEEVENGMNGFHLLIHPGTSAERPDKLYLELENIINYLKKKGYTFTRFNRY